MLEETQEKPLVMSQLKTTLQTNAAPPSCKESFNNAGLNRLFPDDGKPTGASFGKAIPSIETAPFGMGGTG